MRKLTTGLLATYKTINNKYYAAKKERAAKASAAASKVEAVSADYAVTPGDMLGGRYRVVRSIGKGSFGQVVTCVDTKEGASCGREVAVKVIKAREAFRRQAKTEISLLETLNKKDPEDQWCIGERERDREGGGGGRSQATEQWQGMQGSAVPGSLSSCAWPNPHLSLFFPALSPCPPPPPPSPPSSALLGLL